MKELKHSETTEKISVLIVVSGSHTVDIPAGSEELVRQALADGGLPGGEYVFFLGEGEKGTPHRQGITGLKRLDHGVKFSLQPGDNGTCHEIRTKKLPEAVTFEQLFQALDTVCNGSSSSDVDGKESYPFAGVDKFDWSQCKTTVFSLLQGIERRKGVITEEDVFLVVKKSLPPTVNNRMLGKRQQAVYGALRPISGCGFVFRDTVTLPEENQHPNGVGEPTEPLLPVCEVTIARGIYEELTRNHSALLRQLEDAQRSLREAEADVTRLEGKIVCAESELTEARKILMTELQKMSPDQLIKLSYEMLTSQR